MICRICGEDFTPAKKHPGYINVCLEVECRATASAVKMEPSDLTERWKVDKMTA